MNNVVPIIRFSRAPLGVGVQEYAMVMYHLESIKPALANPELGTLGPEIRPPD
jgi:hypothetical protein